MAYDEQLADRLRVALRGEPGVEEKRMFGGLAFLVSGHMAVAASGQGGMMVRCDPDDTGDLLERADVSPFEMRGRGMRGWLRVETPADDAALREWVATGVGFVRTLPPK